MEIAGEGLEYKTGLGNMLRKLALIDANSYEFTQIIDVKLKNGKTGQIRAEAEIYLQPNRKDLNLYHMNYARYGNDQNGNSFGEITMINSQGSLVARLRLKSKNHLDGFVNQYFNAPRIATKNKLWSNHLETKKK